MTTVSKAGHRMPATPATTSRMASQFHHHHQRHNAETKRLHRKEAGRVNKPMSFTARVRVMRIQQDMLERMHTDLADAVFNKIEDTLQGQHGVRYSDDEAKLRHATFLLAMSQYQSEASNRHAQAVINALSNASNTTTMTTQTTTISA